MEKRNNRQHEIEIGLEDVELILGKDYSRLGVFLNNVFCTRCSGSVAIENCKIYLDDTHDIIFDGQCQQCRNSVSRYIETGISPATANFAKHIRTVKLEFESIKSPDK